MEIFVYKRINRTSKPVSDLVKLVSTVEVLEPVIPEYAYNIQPQDRKEIYTKPNLNPL